MLYVEHIRGIYTWHITWSRVYFVARRRHSSLVFALFPITLGSPRCAGEGFWPAVKCNNCTLLERTPRMDDWMWIREGVFILGSCCRLLTEWTKLELNITTTGQKCKTLINHIGHCSWILFFRVWLDLYFFVFLWSGGLWAAQGQNAQRLHGRAGDTIHCVIPEIQYTLLEQKHNTLW